jgi:hypothetical protein
VPTITSFELVDPTPGAGDIFGNDVVILANGNIVVTDPGDPSGALGAGAVHLYDPLTRTLVASIYGDSPEEFLGFRQSVLYPAPVAALPNGNFVVVSPFADVGGLEDAGWVKVFDGTTGEQIGVTVAGDDLFDETGLSGIEVLPNGNFVVASSRDTVNGRSLAGSVMLWDGATGEPIRNVLVGDQAGDQIGGRGSVFGLSNSNFVVTASGDDVDGMEDAGSVSLFDGLTGVLIGQLTGDAPRDRLGSGGFDSNVPGVVELAGGNFVVASPDDSEQGVIGAGSSMV